MEPGRAVVLHQLAYEPSQLRPLVDVKSTIVDLLTAEKAQDAAEQYGRDLIAKVRAGEPIPLSVNAQPLTWLKHEKMTRASGGVPPAVLNKVFAMPKPQAVVSVSQKDSQTSLEKTTVVIDGISNANDFILIELLSVTPGKFELKPDEALQMQAYLSSQLGRLSFEEFFNLHQKQAEIVRR